MSDTPEAAPRTDPRRVIFAIHCVLAIPFTVAAMLLGSLTLSKIVQFHPNYPYRVTLAVYTPVKLGQWFHLFGATGMLILLIIVLTAAALITRRHGSSTRLAAVLLLAHLLFLGTALFAYGLSANQLAGLAVALTSP